MSGKPPEYNGEPIKRAASASPQQASRIPVPIAPKGDMIILELYFGWIPSAITSLYTDVVSFFFSFFSVSKCPAVFIFYHLRSTDFEEKIEGLWTGYVMTGIE